MQGIRFSGIHYLNMNIYPVSDKPFKRLTQRETDIVSKSQVNVIGERNGGGFSRIVLTDQDARNFLKHAYPKAPTEAKALEMARKEREDASHNRSNGFFIKLQAFLTAHPTDANGKPPVVDQFINEPGDRP